MKELPRAWQVLKEGRQEEKEPSPQQFSRVALQGRDTSVPSPEGVPPLEMQCSHPAEDGQEEGQGEHLRRSENVTF